MALLQDQENRIRQQEELRKRKGSKTQQISSGVLLAVLIAVGGVIVVALIFAIPKVTVKESPNTFQQNLQKELAARIADELKTATPKTIDAIRAKTAAGDFTLLATPNIKSTKKNTTITYDLHLVRGKSFDESIELAALNIPETMQAIATPSVVKAGSETASMKITVPGEATVGSYSFTILAKATTKEKTADASFAVTNLSAANIAARDVQPMAGGTKWQATIGWETDIPANTWVEYTTSDQYINNAQQYSFTATDDNASKNHAIILYYLEPDTIYHFRIKSVDDQNNILVDEDKVLITATATESATNTSTNSEAASENVNTAAETDTNAETPVNAG